MDSGQEDLTTLQWIGGGGHAFLRRDFFLSGAPVVAHLQILAEAHRYARDDWMYERATAEYDKTWLLGSSFLKYRLFCNGKAIGAGPLRSLDDRSAVLHTFDLTACCQSGQNTLGILSCGEKYGVAVRLVICLDHDQTLVLGSDSAWKILPGNDIYASISWRHQSLQCFFKGSTGPGEWPEHIDGERFPFGWSEPGFDDCDWLTATPQAAPADLSIERTDVFNYHLTTVPAATISRLADGAWVIDFAREVTGGLELYCPKQAEVEIRLGEERLPDGHVRFQMRTQNCYQERWNFSAVGGRLSHFGIRAFRYAEIRDYPGELRAADIVAVAINAPFTDTDSSFSSSSPELDRVWALCKETIRVSSLDVYTDCPSRERIAYEADTYISLLTHFAIGLNPIFWRRSLRYQIDHLTWPWEWRCFIVPLFLEYYRHTGDREFIQEYYPCLAEFIPPAGLQETYAQKVIVDWPASCRDNYDFGAANTVGNLFGAWSLQALGHLSAALGFQAEAAVYQARFAALKEEINTVLFDREAGLYRDCRGSRHHSFHANVFAVAFDVAEPAMLPGCLDYIEKRGMVCSVYAAQFYLEALLRHGRYNSAWKLLTADNQTSWLGMLRQGALATMEAWSPDQKPNASFCHPWGSAPGNLILRYLIGLTPAEPGWQKVAFNPPPLPWEFKVEITTPGGRFLAIRCDGQNTLQRLTEPTA